MPGTLKTLQEASANLQQGSNDLIEVLRQDRLKKLALMEKQFDQSYEDFILIAANVCGTPSALITLIDATTLKIKSFVGPGVLPDNARTQARDQTMCNLAIQHPFDVFVIFDADLDPRTAHLNDAKNHIVRFYAGAPLTTVDGLALGVLCVVDPVETHEFDETKRVILMALARLVTMILTR